MLTTVKKYLSDDVSEILGKNARVPNIRIDLPITSSDAQRSSELQ